MSEIFGRDIDWKELPGTTGEAPTWLEDVPAAPYDPGLQDNFFQEKFQERNIMANGRPLPTGFNTGSNGWSWLPAVATAGAAVYNAVWGDESSGKGESVAETSTAEWYTDMPYSSGVPTQRQLGMHPHPHPRGLVHRRRRRRKLLTASDKADIAFITGTLGKGEMGRTAIAALLSRRMS